MSSEEKIHRILSQEFRVCCLSLYSDLDSVYLLKLQFQMIILQHKHYYRSIDLKCVSSGIYANKIWTKFKWSGSRDMDDYCVLKSWRIVDYQGNLCNLIILILYL